jgi:hypothetical protein
MTSRAEICRAKAAECETMAGTAQDPKVKETYRDLAARWRDMARQIDTIERKIPKP